MASVFFGGAISLSGSEIDYEAPWGTASSVSILEGAVSYGGQYLYALNPYLAVGAEFNANNFESTTDRIWGAGYAAETITSKMDVYSILPAGRLTVNPAHAFRLYVPLGRGGSRGQKQHDGSHSWRVGQWQRNRLFCYLLCWAGYRRGFDEQLDAGG